MARNMCLITRSQTPHRFYSIVAYDRITIIAGIKLANLNFGDFCRAARHTWVRCAIRIRTCSASLLARLSTLFRGLPSVGRNPIVKGYLASDTAKLFCLAALRATSPSAATSEK